jgi:ribose 5-phosphate isomerase B
VTVAVGSDHAGYQAKRHLVERLREKGLRVVDLGTDSPDSTDYPDFAQAVAHAVADRRAQLGMLVCKTGIGMSIAANKVPGVRAAVCHNALEARLSRAHNDANVLCLGGGILGSDTIDDIVEVWLATRFEGGRHARRVSKLEPPPDHSNGSQ